MKFSTPIEILGGPNSYQSRTGDGIQTELGLFLGQTAGGDYVTLAKGFTACLSHHLITFLRLGGLHKRCAQMANTVCSILVECKSMI
jgi:hypothetical protein